MLCPLDRRDATGFRLLLALVALPLCLLAGRSALAVTATWGGGTGLWDDATRWDTNPNYPCNGQGGANYDVTFGTGTVTLDLNCDIVSFTQSGGVMDGAFDLTISDGFSWTSGTQDGSGTTHVSGGLDVSTVTTKFLYGTRMLVHAGPAAGSWSAGSLNLGSGGSTFFNQTLWSVTGTTRSISDNNDTGSFLNSAIGRLDLDLSDAAQTLTISTGAVQNAGILSANVGTLVLNGDGTHVGDFEGAGTIRFSGGAHVLDAGSNVTVADLEVSGATVDVLPGASFTPANVDLTNGALDVVDAGDTVTVGTATVSGGTLGGDGTFETTGSLAFTIGTMADAGTTRALGGLDVSAFYTKFLSGSRTLVNAGGTGSWSAGILSLGSGGAEVRNEATWNVTGGGRSMSDSLDSASFVNASTGILNVDLDAAGDVLTLSPGTVQNDGTINANLGILALSGSGTHTGTFAGAATVRFGSGTQILDAGSNVTVADLEVSGATVDVLPGASFTPANVDLTNGALDVVDAGDTVTVGTATVSGGTLGGDGTFETTGSLAFTIGTMADAGTTRALGGLDVSAFYTKFLSGSRTLVNAGGTGSWSAGILSLGSGGAEVRNEATWNVTGGGRSMSDSLDSASFVNAATGTLVVDLGDAAQTLAISTGTAANAGELSLRTGKLDFQVSFVQTAGATRLEGGVLEGPPLLDFQGGRLEGAGAVNGNVTMGGTLAPGLSPGIAAGQLDIVGALTLSGGSHFDVEILGATRGTEYDSVTATQAVALGGTLAVDVDGAFRGSVPATPFVVLEQTAGSPLTGSFTNVASGQRVFTPALDSFVARYGPGSPAGADRVVFEDFVLFTVVSTLDVSGTAAGGTITLVIDGVTVDVVLTPGMTAEQVAAAIAAAINGNAALSQLGIAALANGTHVETNGDIESVNNTDPGITLTGPPLVPALGGAAAALLGVLIAALGVRTQRKRACLLIRRS